METRENFSTGSAWEPIIGYSRAVKAGSMIYVSGTTGTGQDGKIVGDAAAQTRQALENIGAALQHFGAGFENIVRTRIFVKDIAADWEKIGRAHGEVFGAIMPTTAMVEVSNMIAPEILVEVEAEAYIGE